MVEGAALQSPRMSPSSELGDTDTGECLSRCLVSMGKWTPTGKTEPAPERAMLNGLPRKRVNVATYMVAEAPNGSERVH